MKLALVSALSLVAIATSFSQTITQWTFEGETLVPSTGTGTATLGTGGTQSFPAGWGSTDSWSSNGWSPGEFFQFEVNTVGFSNIGVSWAQVGSNTGPANFTLQYSTDGISYTNFSSYVVNVSTWNGTLAPAADVYTYDLSAVTALNNDSSVFFRLTVADAVAINGGAVGATGTGRVDNFTVASVPEPTTGVMIGVGLMGTLIFRRRRAL
jgi:hypothetical protein